MKNAAVAYYYTRIERRGREGEREREQILYLVGIGEANIHTYKHVPNRAAARVPTRKAEARKKGASSSSSFLSADCSRTKRGFLIRCTV